MDHGIVDLFLGGVNWELTEKPNVCIAKELANAKQSNAPAHGSVTNAGAQPVHTTPAFAAPNIVAPTPPVDTNAALDNARNLADTATDWDSLIGAIREFKHPLAELSGNIVLPHRPANNASFVVITDLPSSDDEAAGQILTGGAGQLFDKMIGAIGMGRTDIAIIPLVFWRTPGGRTPTRTEIDLCLPFVKKFIELSGCTAALTLGTLAAAEIAGAALPKQHGDATTADVIGMPALNIVPIFHPNYVLLKPDSKRPVWDGLQKLLQIVQNKV